MKIKPRDNCRWESLAPFVDVMLNNEEDFTPRSASKWWGWTKATHGAIPPIVPAACSPEVWSQLGPAQHGKQSGKN